MGTDVEVRLGREGVAGGEAHVHPAAVGHLGGDREVEVLGPQLGLGDGDGLVARHRRVGQPLQRAVAERVPGAQRLRRGRVDAQVGVRRVRRQVVADAGVVGQGDPEERRSLPQGRDGHGLPRVAGQPVAADDDARAVLERWRAEAVPRRPQPDAAGPGLPLGRDDVAGERPQPLAGLVEGGRQRFERGRQPADPFAASSAWYLAVAVSTALRLLSASSGRAARARALASTVDAYWPWKRGATWRANSS